MSTPISSLPVSNDKVEDLIQDDDALVADLLEELSEPEPEKNIIPNKEGAPMQMQQPMYYQTNPQMVQMPMQYQGQQNIPMGAGQMPMAPPAPKAKKESLWSKIVKEAKLFIVIAVVVSLLCFGPVDAVVMSTASLVRIPYFDMIVKGLLAGIVVLVIRNLLM